MKKGEPIENIKINFTERYNSIDTQCDIYVYIIIKKRSIKLRKHFKFYKNLLRIQLMLAVRKK